MFHIVKYIFMAYVMFLMCVVSCNVFFLVGGGGCAFCEFPCTFNDLCDFVVSVISETLYIF